MTNGVKVDLEKPTPLTVLNAVPEVPGKSGAGYYGIAESGETYLETILLIKERTQSGLVRAVDIANELGFSKPSVSRALGQLKDKGLITIEFSGAIVFTPEGLEYAKKVFERHRILTYFLRYVLSVPAVQAEQDACRIEHVISDITVDRMVMFLKENNLYTEELSKGIYDNN
ncbi:MAG: metal-dependent transcriptional regulator [Anaerobiospirillum succiniciproducens]|uniref:metal-dependent transcriptional regulator n=1 Tax=Anaerobiospirillum succiniciproducens TaxID=13335 RepID=UPI0023563F56|nr:metal-dependent transcriptional regulator [Anaerobiospirillum succiniciproducens]MCI6863144.1 metal-dependent transcriptional regulator [Anaerobiospirillum succiniciproducens]MDY2798761.1 metal-dependent transcriptional regulator [Anaerobiospirillum succiniciproducens]